MEMKDHPGLRSPTLLFTLLFVDKENFFKNPIKIRFPHQMFVF